MQQYEAEAAVVEAAVVEASVAEAAVKAGFVMTTTGNDDSTCVAVQALGKVMGSELPHIPNGADTVLYPASVKASTDLQDSLAAAGYKVQRINTYNTVGA